VLLWAAFFEAVERRFGPAPPAAGEVIEYVSYLRSRSDVVARQIDPRSAERLIQSVFVKEDIGDIDPSVVFQIKLVLLAALVAEAGLDGATLDQFLGSARGIADHLLAKSDSAADEITAADERRLGVPDRAPGWQPPVRPGESGAGGRPA
jgi:hypothetical protein